MRTFTFFSLFLYSLISVAQIPEGSWVNYQTNDGVSSLEDNYINVMVMDQNSRKWISTESFSGFTTTLATYGGDWTNLPKPPESLNQPWPSNYPIKDIFVSDSIVLLINQDMAWTYKDGIYTKIFETNKVSPESCYRLMKIIADEDGGVWIATTRGVYYLDSASPEAEVTHLDYGRMFDIAYTPEAGLWIVGTHTIRHFNGTVWKVYDRDNSPMMLGYERSVAIDLDSNIWITDAKRLLKFDGDTWTVFDDVPIDEAWYYKLGEIVVDQNNVLWMTASGVRADSHWPPSSEEPFCLYYYYGNGLLSFDEGVWEKYTSSNSDLLSDTIPGGLMVDEFNNIWVGTENGISIRGGAPGPFVPNNPDSSVAVVTLDKTILFLPQPNPVINETLIAYNLDKETNVGIDLYDASGKLMKSLRLGIENKGRHERTLDLAQFANGFYLVVLITEEETLSQKLLVIK